ncbi:MAG: SDR family oxidoreductase [Rhodocyclaceae bacterium]|jgi:NAD(P)-dependent dehydrogenase (short-subunit alcohol dehydrogenase family)|nr:SDR family oxidoreductase [Rhodocyclaceae bacterium]
MTDSNKLFSMAGRVALVTGAGTGMGARFARTLAGAGAKVVCAARRADKIEATAEAIRTAGGQAVAVSLDIASSDSVRSAFDAAEKAFGRVDTLINNAGQIVFSPFPQVDDNDWNNLINVNFTGNMRMSREFTNRLLAAKQGGAIVNVTSVTGIQVLRNVPAYGSIKAALNQFTRQVAADLFGTGIRCNAIAPGYFSTDMVDWYFETEQGKAEVDRLPSKRVGRVEELDGAVLLLASDAGSFINGVVLPVDAGHSVLLA